MRSKKWQIVDNTEKYIKKALERFDMLNAKPIFTPLAAHFQLEDEVEYMYVSGAANAIRCLMYANFIKLGNNWRIRIKST